VALKKPLDFFNENFPSSSSENSGVDFNANIQKVETVSEAFNSFKNNLEKIDALSDFTETFDKFKSNVEKVSILSEEITYIQDYIKTLLKKEDLENAIMSHLITVDQNIQQIQQNVRSLNSKTLLNIKKDFSDLTEKVEDFISIDAPKYRRLVKESEIRVENRINSIDSSLDEKIKTLDFYVEEKISSIEDKVSGINDAAISSFYEKVDLISQEIKDLIQVEIPKYKRITTENKLKNENDINDLEVRIREQYENIDKRVSEINSQVYNFVEKEIPKYNNLISEVKIKSQNDLDEYKQDISKEIFSSLNAINSLKDEIKEESLNNSSIIKEKLEKIEKDALTSLENIQSINDRYKLISEDFKNREIHNDKKLQSYSEQISSLGESVEEINQELEDSKNTINEKILLVKKDLEKNVKLVDENLKEKILSLETNVFINESHIKEQNKNYDSIKEEIFSIIEKLKINFIEEQNTKLAEKILHIENIFEKFNEKQILNENGSLLTGTSSEKTSDPLTPLDKKFVTFDDLSSHYRQFINRVQIQLASIGGGGAGFMKDLADVEFDHESGNGKLLIYDQSRSMWVGIASTAFGTGGGGGSGGESYWIQTTSGIHTLSNVGVGTTNPLEKLHVIGNVRVTGNISVGGTLTYEDVTNVDSIGVVTARSGIHIGFPGTATTLSSDGSAIFSGLVTTESLNVTGVTTLGSSNGIGTVTIGLGNTALFVDGNARVTGILSVGRSSVVIDGDNNTITSGNVLITGSSITIGDNVTINAGASGINSAPNVIYVAKDGDDSKNGTSIDNAKATIKSAVGIATTGTIVKVLAGTYIEQNPIEVPAFVSVVGNDLKTVTVVPQTTNKDLFHVRKGCYLANMTFINHIAPAAAVGFPTSEVATNVGGGKWESPYIQNCTSNTTTGTGLRIDGNQAEGLKSIVCDSYTQYNQGGVGVAITNGGYAQLVSVFTICCDVGISCHKGAQCSLTNSNTSFGTYGLVADGRSDLQFSGIVTQSATAGQDTITVSISTSTRPYDGQVVFFGTLYYSIDTITVIDGGSGYLTTPSVTIASPDGPNGQTATAFATLNGSSVESITIISSGNQYSSSPVITISAPDSGVTATASANIAPLYYTINSSTPVTAGITTLTLNENLNNTIGVGTTSYFYQISRINASSHTFEYVGSGNDITSATPLTGGVPIQDNEVIERDGGTVVYTSTDQAGNFRIGNGLQINQNTGTISGRAFTRSLFSEMTPFILALS